MLVVKGKIMLKSPRVKGLIVALSAVVANDGGIGSGDSVIVAGREY